MITTIDTMIRTDFSSGVFIIKLATAITLAVHLVLMDLLTNYAVVFNENFS